MALPKTGNSIRKSCPVSAAPLYGKTGSAMLAVIVALRGAAPAPPASSQEQKKGRRHFWTICPEVGAGQVGPKSCG